MTVPSAPLRPRARPWRSAARLALETALDCTPLAGRLLWRLPATPTGVALTFDDGPDPEITPRVLDVLAEAGARATFFVLGERAERYPDLVRRALAEGHAVGNHTYSHAACRSLGLDEFRKEVDATDAILESLGAGGRSPFRPPWGEIRLPQAASLLRAGRRVALWSWNTRDYQQAPPEAIAAAGSAVAARDVLLLHDRFEATAEALPELLERLHARGLKTVTLAEGTHTGSPASHRKCHPRDADTSRCVTVGMEMERGQQK